MPVEIRELIIKTTIESSAKKSADTIDESKLKELRQQIVQECLKTLKNQQQKNIHKR